MDPTGVRLGQLVLALDSTLVTLIDAPRGLDLRVRSAALIDSDDVRLGLSASTESSDIFFLLGISDADALRWIDRLHGQPAAIFIKGPSAVVVDRARGVGVAVIAVQPQARWERLYRLVNHVFEHHHHRDGRDATDPFSASLGSDTDLFALAQSVADRTRGMVSIEDAQSHVLAYSASTDEADELRRLSILGRAGPPEHLRWLAQWGVFDALRTGADVVQIAERPELSLRPRLAIGIHRRSPGATDIYRRSPARDRFLGSVWIQQGSAPLAEDSPEVLRGAAVLAARIIARLVARPSTHVLHLQQLFGLADRDGLDIDVLAHQLGFAVDAPMVVIGFDTAIATGEEQPRAADALALSASAFRPDAHVTHRASRVYVMFPDCAVASWVRGTIATLRRELGHDMRAVIAAPVSGLAAVATTRMEIDRVLDSAARHPIAINPVTTLAEAHATVLLDEIVTMVGSNNLIDPRIRNLRANEPALADSLRIYLDCFGDIAAAAAALQVHPNTVRYRVRRLEKVLGTPLDDPEVRLLLSLSLRVTA